MGGAEAGAGYIFMDVPISVKSDLLDSWSGDGGKTLDWHPQSREL